jgi:hypothetical protein
MPIVCKYCNNEFTPAQKELNRGNGKFCSLGCSGKGRAIKVKEPNCSCAQCSTSFYRSCSKLKNSKSGLQFCSRSCKEKAQKLGGIREIMPPHYGKASVIKYRKLFDEADLQCARCGYAEFRSAVHIHHKDQDRNNNTKDNLIPLCACCHSALHDNLWHIGDLI